MDYEKKYKEAFAKIREGIQPLPDGAKISGVTRAFLEEVFPELKESEDEKIRKALIRFHKSTIDVDGIKGDDILAWLEKQGQTFTKKDVDDAYLKGISDAKNELEKQGKQDARYRCLEELLAADDIYQMSVNDTMTNEAKEKAAKALSKLCIGKLLGFEKQGEQKTDKYEGYCEGCNNVKGCVTCVDGDQWAHYKEVEQNPADKVEPKFHKGEWIVWKNKCYKVNYNGCGYELIDQNGLSTWLEYGTVDENAHLWDITKDAKKGDVLVHNGCTFIFMGIENGIVQAFEENLLYGNKTCNFGEPDKDNDYSPATQEQRDLLFKKMKESGCEWDAEKKELKKIEQKKDIYNKLTDFESSLKHIMEEAIECGDTHNLKADADMLLRLVQKPAEWSEEDERKSLEIKCLIGNYRTGNDEYELCSWIDKLKDRVQPQPKQEWSEEDENIYNAILDTIYNNLGLCSIHREWFKNIKERLKSLRPQKQWKPTEEQIEALLKLEEMHVLEHERNQENAHLYMVVKSIREQLLKLRRE